MRKKNIKPYYVLNWDINRNKVEHFDIMPYLTRTWDEEKKRKYKTWRHIEFGKYNERETKMPDTFDEFKEFILGFSQYQFWSRCEYEIIISDWPCQKHEEKIDVFHQIEMNIDVITKHFIEGIK